jgi:hypothetical protein
MSYTLNKYREKCQGSETGTEVSEEFWRGTAARKSGRGPPGFLRIHVGALDQPVLFLTSLEVDIPGHLRCSLNCGCTFTPIRSIIN